MALPGYPGPYAPQRSPGLSLATGSFGPSSPAKESLISSDASVHYDFDSNKLEINGNKRSAGLLILQEIEKRKVQNSYINFDGIQITPSLVVFSPLLFEIANLFKPKITGTFDAEELELLVEMLKEIASLKDINSFM